MSGLPVVIAVAFALTILVVLPTLAPRILRLSEAELLSRLGQQALSGWHSRVILAGVCWGVYWMALSVGILAAVAGDVTDALVLDVVAIAAGILWILATGFSIHASLTGRPRWLLLPQVRGHVRWPISSSSSR